MQGAMRDERVESAGAPGMAPAPARTRPRAVVFMAALVLAGALAALAGCGGGAASAGSSRPAASSSGTPAPGSPAAALAGYLAQVKPLYQKEAALTAQVAAVLQPLGPTPGAAWTAAAGKVAAAAKQTGDLSQGFSLIPPPGFLAAAHQAIVAGLADSQTGLTVLAQDLRSGAAATSDQRVVGSLDRSATLQTQWKGALLAASKKYGVTIPWQWGVATH